MLIRVSVLLVTLSVMLVSPGIAQQTNVSFGGLKGDPTLPVAVEADSLDVNQNDGTALLQGSVVVSQGEMQLSADRVFVVYNSQASGIERLEAEGNVLLVSGPDAAESNRAEYTIDSGVVVMTGNVLLTQGPAAITGDRMTVQLTEGTAQMTGRVRTVLQPQQD